MLGGGGMERNEMAGRKEIWREKEKDKKITGEEGNEHISSFNI